VSEEFAFDEGFRNRPAVDSEKGTFRTSRRGVKKPGHPLFAGAALASNEDGAVELGYTCCLVHNPAHGRTLGNDPYGDRYLVLPRSHIFQSQISCSSIYGFVAVTNKFSGYTVVAAIIIHGLLHRTSAICHVFSFITEKLFSVPKQSAWFGPKELAGDLLSSLMRLPC
jgi:hypothetical protein